MDLRAGGKSINMQNKTRAPVTTKNMHVNTWTRSNPCPVRQCEFMRVIVSVPHTRCDERWSRLCARGRCMASTRSSAATITASAHDTAQQRTEKRAPIAHRTAQAAHEVLGSPVASMRRSSSESKHLLEAGLPGLPGSASRVRNGSSPSPCVGLAICANRNGTRTRWLGSEPMAPRSRSRSRSRS